MRRAGAIGLAALALVLPGSASAAAPGLLWQAPEDGQPGAGAGQLLRPSGIGADPNSGHVYVADSGNSRIAELTAWGEFVKAWGWGVVASGPGNQPPLNERQEVAISATAGSFALRYLDTTEGGNSFQQTTSAIAFNASPAAIQSALEGLSGLSPGDVAVSGASGGPWTVEFTGNLADRDVLPLQIVNSTLSGGAETAAVQTLQGGGSYEVCVAADGDVCQAGQKGYAAGELFSPVGVAVDDDGNVYVEELVTGGSGEEPGFRVQKFDSDGSFLLMFGAGQLSVTPVFGNRIAVGPEGDVFVGDVGRIQRFGSDGAYKGEVAVPGETIQSLAMDGAGNFYLALAQDCCLNSKAGVRKLSPSGSPLAPTFGAVNPRAVAVDAAGDVFAVDKFFGSVVRVVEFTPDGSKLVPSAEEEAEAKKAEEEEKSFALFLESNSIEGFGWNGLATGSGCGIAGSDLYVSGQNNADDESKLSAYGPPPSSEACPPPPAPPTIAAQYAVSADPDGATVKANVNPRFWFDTTYYVEYGTGKCSEGGCTAKQPPAVDELDAGTVNAPVATRGVFLPGLQPSTTYRFRFVAQSSGGGPVYGVDPDGAGPEAATPGDGLEGTFTTPAPSPPLPDPDPCANATLRTGPSAFLADCRAHEMVSPVDKGNGDILPLFNTTNDRAALDQAALGGEMLTYSAARAFGDAEAAPYTSQYMARRGQAGWSSDAIAPPRNLSILGNGSLESEYRAFGEDLCDAWLLHDTDPLLAEGGVEGFANLYRADLCGGAGYEALTTVKPPNHEGSAKTYFPELQGMSADGTVAAFRVADKLTASASAGANLQCYESRGGKLRLISVLPNGQASKIDCSVGTANSIIRMRRSSVDHAVSEDGSRIFWTATAGVSGPGQIYLRIDGKNPTVAVSEAGETLSGDSAASQFWTAAADGSKAIYSVGDLEKGTAELYEFDVDAKATKPIAGEVRGQLGAGDDASRIYLVSEEGLDGAADGEPNLYLYEAGEGGGFTFIGVLSEEDAVSQPLFAISPVALEPVFHPSRVSPDGLHAAFMSTAGLTGFDNVDADSGEPDAEVYLYDAAADGLLCVSCNPTGVRPSGREVVLQTHPTGQWAAAQIPGWETQLYASRVLSEDGSRLFFESHEALVPRDTNAKQDVYEWEEAGAGDCSEASPAYSPPNGGCLSLISSGQSPEDSGFVDASADGRDVFFTTSSSLLVQDPGLIDIYDARAGGGFPPPPLPPARCQGEACQSPAPAPEDPTPASATFVGPADPEARPAKPRRCPKGKRRVRKAGKARCVGRHRAGKR